MRGFDVVAHPRYFLYLVFVHGVISQCAYQRALQHHMLEVTGIEGVRNIRKLLEKLMGVVRTDGLIAFHCPPYVYRCVWLTVVC